MLQAIYVHNMKGNPVPEDYGFGIPVLEYHPFQSYGEPIRLLLADLGLNWIEKGIEDFREHKMNCERYPYNQVPILEVNGVRYAQMAAITQYVAQRAGRNGSGNAEQDAKVWMLAASAADMLQLYTQAIWENDEKKGLVAFVKNKVPKIFAQYEHQLQTSSATLAYFVYEYPSYPEYSIMSSIYAIAVLNPAALTGFPALRRWYERMRSRKGIKAYLDSGKQFELINQINTGQEPLNLM